MALLNASSAWLHAVSLVAFVAILTSILVAIYSQGEVRAFSIGFALFGGSYFLTQVMFLSVFDGNPIILFALDYLEESLPDNDPEAVQVDRSPNTTAFYFEYIRHALASIVFGYVGGTIASFVRSRQKPGGRHCSAIPVKQ